MTTLHRRHKRALMVGLAKTALVAGVIAAFVFGSAATGYLLATLEIALKAWK